MRRLTVSSLRREWGHTYRTRQGYVPSIRLNGNWLAEAGFLPGQKVAVIVGNAGLHIRPEGEAASPART